MARKDQSLALVVITLLQLCRAEIPYLPSGTWFSANTINDGFSPKPISELFSTEAPQGFSSTKPIIVPEFSPLSSSLSSEPDVAHLSSTVTTFGSYPTSTPIPPVSFPPSSIPSTSFSSLDFSQTPSIVTQWPSDTTVFQKKTTNPTLQTLQQSLATSPLTPPPSPPDFFVVYQNPQALPGVTVTQRPTDVTQTSVIVSRPVSTTTTPFITNGLSDGTSRPTVTFRSTPPTVFSPSTTARTTIAAKDCNPVTLVSPITAAPPLQIVTGPPTVPFRPKLRIQVVAPKGSITNVKINPPTTTKAPPTRKTKKPKRNSYEGCLDGCRGRRDPICGVPLASTIIDTKTLKGFPSVCHMACHNSYKKDAYEKLVDGRCGRLRTRIISVDTNAKIQRHELKKTEYSVVNTGPQTVVEFAHDLPPK